MLLTIYNLPLNARFQDVKSLIQSKCGISEIILDNLVSNGPDSKKITVGLPTDEDAATLMRNLNGLYISGKVLYVEDIRNTKRNTDQSRNTRNDLPQYQNQYQYAQNQAIQNWYQALPNQYQTPQNAYQGSQNQYQALQNQYQGIQNQYQKTQSQTSLNQFQGSQAQKQMQSPYQGSQSSYMGQMGQQSNMASIANAQWPSTYTPTAQNRNGPRAEQQVQYPPQGMYQRAAKDQTQQEPLGFRSEGTSNVRSTNPWARNDGAKKSFSQRDDNKRPWSPARDQGNDSSKRSRWGNGNDNFNRDARRRDSPPRHRGYNERDKQPGTSRSDYREPFNKNERNRSPQKPVDRFAPKGFNREQKPTFDRPRETKRDNFNTPQNEANNKFIWTNPNVNQTWKKPNNGSQSNYNNWKVQNKAVKRPHFALHNEPQPKKAVVKKPSEKSEEKPKFSGDIGDKCHTWRSQVASQIAKEMLRTVPYTSDVDTEIFFKELKNTIRNRLAEFCHPKVRPDEMVVKFRKKHKKEDDAAFFEEVIEKARVIQEEMGETKIKRKRWSEDDFHGMAPTFKQVVCQLDYPYVPKGPKKVPPNAGAAPKPFIAPQKPKATQKKNNKKKPGKTLPKNAEGDKPNLKEQKKQNKLVFENEELVTELLEPEIAAALDAEADIFTDAFKEGCQNPSEEEKQLVETMSTIVADYFKRTIKVQVARRILDEDQPMVRVYSSPKMIKRALLAPWLLDQGVTTVKKATHSKHPMLVASCSSYAVLDKLCAGQFLLHGFTITFKPLQMAGPPSKASKDNAPRIQFDYSRMESNANTNVSLGDGTEPGSDMQTEETNLNKEHTLEQTDNAEDNINDLNEGEENVTGNDINTDISTSEVDVKKEATEDKITEPEIVSVKNEKDAKNTDEIDVKDSKSGQGDVNDDTFVNAVKMDDFTDDVDVMVKGKDTSVDDCKIVEDTMGCVNNNENVEIDGTGQVGEVSEEQDDGIQEIADEKNVKADEKEDEDDDDEHGEDYDIGDIDENDLEDY